MSPIHSKTVPTTENQALKYMNLWGHSPANYHNIRSPIENNSKWMNELVMKPQSTKKKILETGIEKNHHNLGLNSNFIP